MPDQIIELAGHCKQLVRSTKANAHVVTCLQLRSLTRCLTQLQLPEQVLDGF